MKQIQEFTDERLRGYCVYCGGGVSDPSNDHVPSKSLLKKPYPTNIPTIKACKGCNEEFALDEEYFAAFLSAVISGSTKPDDQVLPSAANSFSTNSGGLRDRIQRSQVLQTCLDLGVEERLVWMPEFDRIKRVIVKNARGHGYYELGDPNEVAGCPTSAWATTLDNITKDQENGFFSSEPGLVGWPEVGSRAMIRAIEGQDLQDGWIVVQENVYRYSVEQGTRVRSVLFEHVITEVVWDDDIGI